MNCFEVGNKMTNDKFSLQKKYTEYIKNYNDAVFAESGERRKAYIVTFGCQQNEADGEKMSGLALLMGYELTKEPAEASLILVNTCAIREHAEQKALSIIGQYKHLKQKRPELIIGVCGCMVTQEHRVEEIKRSYPYVDFIVGTSAIHKIPELIYERRAKDKRLFCREDEYRVVEGMPTERENTYRAWVSIMYGCNNFCSYCIVPYVRGRERSREKADIIKEVQELVAKGYKDITLLGQNVNSYGKDLENKTDFADLLADLDKIEGDYTIHFMTSHPKDATRKLIDVMADGVHIANHFHLPMQSGSDKVLRDMNRRYDFHKYIGILDYIKEKMPGVTTSSDIIVGFPGETEEDFEATLDALRRARFDMIYSFIYSPRKGTPAAEMAEQIPDKIKSERFDRLLATQNAVALELNRALEGKVLRVLCDGRSKNNSEMFTGRTDGNKIVFFDGEDSDEGKFIDILVERGETFALWGRKLTI